MKGSGGLTVCNDARHLGSSELCCLFALVAIKHPHKAAADLVLTPMPGLEVWQSNVAILLILSLA